MTGRRAAVVATVSLAVGTVAGSPIGAVAAGRSGPAHSPAATTAQATGMLGPTSTGAVATRALLARRTLRDAAGHPLDGRGTSVAVIDTGIEPGHPAFLLPGGGTKVVRLMTALPCLADGEQVGPVTQTELSSSPSCVSPLPSVDADTGQGGHGSMIGGIVAGDSYRLPDGTSVGGVAPGARLVVIQASTALVGIDNAFRWVLAHHAHPCGAGVSARTCPPIRVVNCSWGANDPVIFRVQDMLARRGVLTVWANGNGGGDGTTSQSNVESTQDRTPGILSVADYNDQGTGSRNATLDPGSSRGARNDPRTWPEISAPGTNMISACRPYEAVCPAIETEPPRDGPGSDNPATYFIGTGTSFSAPVVDGIVAMLFQIDPGASAGRIARVIEQTAHRFESGGPYRRTPYGHYLASYAAGAGLIDAYAAALRLGAHHDGHAGRGR